MIPSTVAAYFARFGFCDPALVEPPETGLGLVVVIPCCGEPALLDTLESLRACPPPSAGVEIIVVVNGAEDASPAVKSQNGRTARRARDWAVRHGAPGFRIHVLEFPNLPAKRAGVGLARKIGMDEALARLHEAGNPDAIIANLDADCRCEPGYLAALENHFRKHPASDGCAVYFEHRLDDAGSPLLREGILQYELTLRIFNLGLKFCGYPFAYHTLGSCMAVRADAYRRQGGMNRRQAGEDFYFLNKFMTLGTFTELTETTVYPSPRPSHRVPFGTGKAMRGWLQSGGAVLETYDPRVFAEMGKLLEKVGELRDTSADRLPALLAALPRAMAEFLENNNFGERLAELQQNSASAGTFRKRFFRWFDRFRVLKYVHFATEHHIPRIGVFSAAAQLLAWRCLCRKEEVLAAEPQAVLEHLRRMERERCWLPFDSPSRAAGR